MRRLLFIITLLLTQSGLVAQEDLIERLYSIIALEVEYPDSALILSEELLKEGYAETDSLKVSYALFRVGNAHFEAGRFRKAIPFFQQSYDYRLALGDYVASTSPIELIAKCYFKLGEIDSAFYGYTKGLKILDQYDEAVKSRLQLHISMAVSLMEYEDYDEAFQHIVEAEELLEIEDELESRSLIEQTRGIYYYHIDSLDKAIIHYQNAYRIDQELENTSGMVINASNLALCYRWKGNYDMALFYNRSVCDYYKSTENEYELAIQEYNLALLFNDMNAKDSAEKYYSRSLQVFEEYEDLQLQYDCLSALGQLWTEEGEFQKVAEMQDRLLSLKDSIISSDKIRSIAELRTEYETEQKEQEINLLNAEAEREEARRNSIVFLSIGIIVLLSFLIYRYRQNLKFERAEKELSQKQVDVIMGEQEVKMYNALLLGQEEERDRISRDLHDQLGSMLTAVKFKFAALEEDPKTKGVDELSKLSSMIDTACEEVRRISHDLASGSISGFGLAIALEKLSENLGGIRSDFRVNYQTHGKVEIMSPHLEQELYKISQEIMNNILKHSEATIVNIDLTYRPDAFVMNIEDNGVGFNKENALANGGLGLKSLLNRAESIGGILHIDTQAGRGSSFHLELNRI